MQQLIKQRQHNSTVRGDSDRNRKVKYTKNLQSIGGNVNIKKIRINWMVERQQLTDGVRTRINR